MVFSQSRFVRAHRRTVFALAALLSPCSFAMNASAQVVLRTDADRAPAVTAPSAVYPAVDTVNASGSNDKLVSHLDRDYEFRQLQQAASLIERERLHVRNLIRLVMPSVVHIEASKKAEHARGQNNNRIDEAGAGVVVQLNGRHVVITNRHVVHPADLRDIRIETKQQQLRPVRLWHDPSTDVAVIEVDGDGLIPAHIGNSDSMEIGDSVFAFGSPFGLQHSVTSGILSAKNRRNLELGSRDIEIQDFFQTDAAINPGNSGGPLLNLRGEVIGINTAIASNSGGNEGIGFTIPINMALTVADQLISRGKLERSYLGVQLEAAFSGSMARQLGLPNNEGALVKSVNPDSPAERANLQVGDVVLEFDGVRIQNDGHLVERVGLTPLGKQVNMIIFRNRTKQDVAIRLDPRPE